MVLLLVGSGFLLQSYLRGETEEEEQVLSRTVRVRTGDMFEIFYADGTVQTKDRKEIRTRISGEIESVFVAEGDKVEEGDLLVQLKQEEYLDRIQRGEEDLLRAETALSKAEIDHYLKEIESPGQIQRAFDNVKKALSRVEELESMNSIEEEILVAKRDLRHFETIYNMVTGLDRVFEEEAKKKEALEALQRTKEDLLQTTITAPTSGTVTNLSIEEGEYIGANTRVASITSYQQVMVMTNIDEFDIRSIEPGQEARIIPDAYPDSLFRGTVTRIAHEASRDGGLVVFETSIFVENPQEILRPGMTVEVEIITEEKKEILLVPTQAIEYREGQPFVIITDGEEEILQRVRTGLNDGTNIEITSGLEEGDSILVYMRIAPTTTTTSPTQGIIPGLPGSSRMGR